MLPAAGQAGVFVAPVDEDGHVSGEEIRRVADFEYQRIGSVSYTASGGLVASYAGGEAPGIYYRPFDPDEEFRRLTAGNDIDPVGLPSSRRDWLVFSRDGNLYLTLVGGARPNCTVALVITDSTRELCPLTQASERGAGEFDTDASWSWNGRSLAFLRGPVAGPGQHPGPPDEARHRET